MISESVLGPLIQKAAEENQQPEVGRSSGKFSPGFIDVYLCDELVESFDTYYYTAKGKADALVEELKKRISICSENSIKELQDEIAKLKHSLVAAYEDISYLRSKHNDHE